MTAGLAGSAQATDWLALNGLDPVLLVEGREAAGQESLTAVQDGYTYQFSSQETLKRFQENPTRYSFQGGGACTAMPSARARPDLYTVHEGKLYGFGSTGCKEEFLASPAAFLEGAEPQKVAILIFDGVELLDFAGPGEVFAAALGGQAFEVFTVAATRDPIVSQGFVTVTPEHTLKSSPKADVLVVPGGSIRGVLESEETMAWIKETASSARAVLSVCNGALVLARAPLLDGLEATTHHSSLDALAEWAPKTRVRDDLRWVDNGRILTAAGVSTGIDASLHLVRKLVSPAAARLTARYLEYPWTGEAAAAGDPMAASR